jgi:hypothetical protein
VDFYRDTPAIILDADRAIRLEGDCDAVTAAGHGFINTVVDDFVDQMMEPALVGATDVHARAAAHRLPSAQYLDVSCGIVAGSLGSIYIFI